MTELFASPPEEAVTEPRKKQYRIALGAIETSDGVGATLLIRHFVRRTTFGS